MTTVAPAGPVITGWSAVSALGYRSGDFAAGLRDRRPAVRAVDTDRWQVADRVAGIVPDFSPREVLGKKNTRAMDRLTGLAVTAVGQLVTGIDDDEGSAVVLGTTTGSQQSMTDITRDTLIHDKPFYIEAAQIPNAIMNSAAAQCAIWYQLRGPNATVAAGRASGVSALTYARRLLAAGRARTVLCGAAEEYSTARSWWDWHGRDGAEPSTPPGEGCAMIRVEAAGAPDGLADVLATGSGLLGDAAQAPAVLDRCLRATMRRAGVSADEVWAVSASEPSGPAGAAEAAVLADVYGAHRPVRPGEIGLIGDTAGATAAFQLVALLSMASDDASSRGRPAVLTSVDPEGVFGCAVLRLR
ncbi:beta-ketoacyl synthase N-terminal-like domain-containing protein [Virgisporangium ochraceum]|uniref:3-oxoacyl-ACP synthase n=1 Tax=Virgisporangium ochraceum TaxID=65505 RepID=A0A8J4A4C3_9ACTN|nr:beta-ketoacyl synthase N-terminal-like domain-containing protein [Virgisporangium ochraceum]GIJ74911.1 3-oxoacyl-ACP synthase [Virgisporangium ochraceum]